MLILFVQNSCFIYRTKTHHSSLYLKCENVNSLVEDVRVCGGKEQLLGRG